MRSRPTFQKILIANRGEIALRVQRSARAAGYRTVAVCSTADTHARHALEADESVCIGGPLPAESYLRIDAIIDAARRTGADAVHPGYGFLAENAAFAQACTEAGLVFIGPSAEAIRAMGHKAGAKRIMQAAGVPCVPGYEGEDQDEARLLVEAERIGWPVMIKAAAGGGGRGMRLVERADDFAASLRIARSEAANAFGDPTLILERAIVRPRHIEIQVLADRLGHVVHLGERDCSVQRRHQKIIEEAPSPAVDAELRERMGAVAIAATRAIGYVGVGTLEFLLDAQGRFYFMEMNTRLQVEHPVTEAITGLDLVDLQLRVAAGEPLPFGQADLRFHGHAIEVRLCAEDVRSGFLPQSGRLEVWRPAPALRVEHALCDGAAVPPFYDSMIAKLVAHGRTREEARRRLRTGLQDTVALGLTTNQGFLIACLDHPAFADGNVHTGFIADHADALLAADESADAQALALAAVLLRTVGTDGVPIPDGAAPDRLPVRLWLRSRGVAQAIRVTAQACGGFEVQAGDRHWRIGLVRHEPGLSRLTVDGVTRVVAWHRDGAWTRLSIAGQVHEVEDLTRAPAERHGGPGQRDGRVRASMNGRAVAVHVEPGETVAAGQPLVTLEAMKMEHVHSAPAPGVIRAVHVRTGEQVGAGRVVVEIDAVEIGVAAASVQVR
jgi:geranyl-CoA carboxylase alpha subunit